MTIPPMNEVDRDRDPLEDYEYGMKQMRVNSSALLAWVRRAVAAETALKEAHKEIEELRDLCGDLSTQ